MTTTLDSRESLYQYLSGFDAGDVGAAVVYAGNQEFVPGTFEPAGTASGLMAAHLSALNPHNQYLLASSFNPAAFDPAGSAAAAASGAASALSSHVAAANPHTVYLLSAAYTAADVLAKLLTVDGASSGLDADLLDGLSSLAYVKADGSVTGATTGAQSFTTGLNVGTSTVVQLLTLIKSTSDIQMWIGSNTTEGYTLGRNRTTGMLDILGTQGDPFRGINVLGKMIVSGSLTVGSLIFPNNTAVQWLDGATARNILLYGGNDILIGKSAYGGSMYLYTGASGGVINFVDNTQLIVNAQIANDGSGYLARNTMAWTTAGILNFKQTMSDSTKVPGTDAPVDWVQIQIAGTTRYIPVYAA